MNKPERIGEDLTAGEDTAALMLDLGRKARQAAGALALATREERMQHCRRQQALSGPLATMLSLLTRWIWRPPERLAGQMRSSTAWRLMASVSRAIAAGLEAIAELDDPVGATIADWRMPNKLKIERVRTPLGVIGVIYESRPNVTADAGGLCLKAGNAAILRGGSRASTRAAQSTPAWPRV